MKPLSRSAPTFLGGGYFGPKENNVCQSAATSAGSLGLLFTSGFPAAYQLGLLSANPKDDFARLITFTICCAFFGLSFTQPLRKFYILKLKLVFPSGVAAAYTIQSLHAGKNAEVTAKKKTKALFFSFLFAISLRVVSEYAPGLLWDWHIFYALNRIGWSSVIAAESWVSMLPVIRNICLIISRKGWIWEWTPAFIGAGMLTGINASYSFIGGVCTITMTAYAADTTAYSEFPRLGCFGSHYCRQRNSQCKTLHMSLYTDHYWTTHDRLSGPLQTHLYLDT